MGPETRSAQTTQLIAGMAHWLELFDEEHTYLETPLPQRPLQTLLHILREGAVELRLGEEKEDLSEPAKHLDEVWFRVLFAAVEAWYEDTYGADAIRGKGIPPMLGFILMRGSPFRLEVPATRRKVHKVGSEAWCYFEDGVHSEESPAAWLVGAPDIRAMDAERRIVAEADLQAVASQLRYIFFRRSGVKGIVETRFADNARANLESAAGKILTGQLHERGPAWWDLQMAMESALKLVLQAKTGKYPKTHSLLSLLKSATAQGVVFDEVRLTSWPPFHVVSDYRYSQSDLPLRISSTRR